MKMGDARSPRWRIQRTRSRQEGSGRPTAVCPREPGCATNPCLADRRCVAPQLGALSKTSPEQERGRPASSQQPVPANSGGGRRRQRPSRNGATSAMRHGRAIPARQQACAAPRQPCGSGGDDCAAESTAEKDRQDAQAHQSALRNFSHYSYAARRRFIQHALRRCDIPVVLRAGREHAIRGAIPKWRQHSHAALAAGGSTRMAGGSNELASLAARGVRAAVHRHGVAVADRSARCQATGRVISAPFSSTARPVRSGARRRSSRTRV